MQVVHINVRIPEIIRERVPGRRASDGKSPAAVRAETVTRYDQKTSTRLNEGAVLYISADNLTVYRRHNKIRALLRAKSMQ